MKIFLHYAHCTNFTPGLPDRYPFSQYVHAEAEVEVEQLVLPNYEPSQYRISSNARVLSCEGSIAMAVASAQYRLMDESREAAALTCKPCKPTIVLLSETPKSMASLMDALTRSTDDTI